MANRKDSERIKPGILIDKKVWAKFKEKYSGNTSQQVEQFMKLAAEYDKVEVYNASGLESASFANPTDWSVSYSDNHLNVSCCNETSNDSGVILSWGQTASNLKSEEEKWK